MLVGHSMGAQLVGFTANNNHLKAVIGIATSTGTWWKMKLPHMFASMLLWYVIHPVLTPIFGYAPLRSLGIMEDLPKRVIKQWRAWCKSEFYFADHIGKTIPMDSFYPLKVPLIVHYFKDDPIATDKTVTDFTAIYRGTRTRMIKHRAKDYYQKKVGHFRMFHSDFEKSFWRTIVHEIDRFMQPDHG